MNIWTSTESEPSAGSGWAPGSSGRVDVATGTATPPGPPRDIVRRARALGVALFDTAEIYGLGKSERILGEALGDERSEVAVASKIFPVAPFPAVIKARERASARRLQLDRIPLYQIHQPNPVVPDSVIMPGSAVLTGPPRCARRPGSVR